MTVRVLLPAEFQDVHRRAALAWVRRGHQFSLEEWRVAIQAFDLLKEAAIVAPDGILPFPMVYYRYIESQYAVTFIQTLLDAADIETEGMQAWASVAQRIMPELQKSGLTSPKQPATRLLTAYCLYWWYAFAYGYMFEVEILRDLEQSGIQFTAHDLTQRQARLSAWDLEVLGFRGDIKRSLAFLQTARGRHLPLTFYIVRLTKADRSQTLVVMMRQAMWDEIDGDTTLTILSRLPDVLPKAARLIWKDIEIMVADYALWKQRVLKHQSTKEDRYGQ
jgi:hypothetical protein